MFAKLKHAQKPNIRENIASVAVSRKDAKIYIFRHCRRTILFLPAPLGMLVGGRFIDRSSHQETTLGQNSSGLEKMWSQQVNIEVLNLQHSI